MREIQIICKNRQQQQQQQQDQESTSELQAWLEMALSPIAMQSRIKAQYGHCLIKLFGGDPVNEILQKCREVSYAYLRVIAWEMGGGIDNCKGMAQCVGAHDGEALTPVFLHGPRSIPKPNGQHAMFRSRRALTTAIARRWANGRWEVMVAEHRIDNDEILPPKSIMNTSLLFADDHTDWPEGYEPLIRAAIEKVGCVGCTHCHYAKKEEEVEVVDEREW